MPTTIGAALGTVVVGVLLDLSWPARLGLLALAVVAGLAWLRWRQRAESEAAGVGDLPPTDLPPADLPPGDLPPADLPPGDVPPPDPATGPAR